MSQSVSLPLMHFAGLYNISPWGEVVSRYFCVIILMLWNKQFNVHQWFNSIQWYNNTIQFNDTLVAPAFLS